MSDQEQITEEDREQLATAEQAALAAYDRENAARTQPTRDALAAAITHNADKEQQS